MGDVATDRPSNVDVCILNLQLCPSPMVSAYGPNNSKMQAQHDDIRRPDGIVSAKLEHFDDVKECPPFIALSYTWGTTWAMREIELNGSRFEVRQNLYDIMENARFARSEWARKVYDEDAATAVIKNPFFENPILWEYWWIDDICIDQNSIRERNHQVRIMSDIYSEAAFVFVWLGIELHLGRGKEHALKPINNNHKYDIKENRPASPHTDRDVTDTASTSSCTMEIAEALLDNPY